MIRPFNLEVYNVDKGQLTNHRGEIIGKKLPINTKFYNKLFSHPITVFAYNIASDDKKNIPNPKFDRHDVIRALDFWIEYWVYQNKCDYILEGTVNKDFELTVRELIETREAVLKCPADTQFVRKKIRANTYEKIDIKTQKFKPKIERDKDIIEFTENVVDSSNSSSMSTVDQFCYVVRKMTYKEYIMKKNGILHLPNATQADIDELSRTFASAAAIMIHNFTENFRDVGARFDFGMLNDEISGKIWAGRHLDDSAPALPLGLGDLVVFDRVTNRFRRATGDDPLSEIIRLNTKTQSPEFLRWILEGTFEIPPNNHLMPGDMFTLQNFGRGNMVIAHGTVTEELNPGDIVRLNENTREWVKVVNPIDSPNFNPNMPATVPERDQHNSFNLISGLHPGIPPSSTEPTRIKFHMKKTGQPTGTIS